MAVMDWGWQGKTGKLRRRGQYVFRNNSIPADIVFRVRNKEGDVEEILAHKVLMAMGSNVFEEKLYGSNMEAVDQMTITNHKADAFRIVLQYLYSDRAPGLNAENAMVVLRCAEEYHIADLVVECQMQMLQELRTLAAANDVLFAMVKTSEPSRQSLVSANVGQEKEEFQDEKANEAARVQSTLQMQALMNSSIDSVQPVSKSMETESEEIHKTLQDSSTTDAVKSLATLKTGWELNHGKGLGGMVPEEPEKDKILSEVRVLLDKLTPNNYVRLSDRMLKIPFTKTGELLIAVVDAVVAKALDEQNYAELYAKLCRKLIDLHVPQEAGADPAKSIKFRTVLLQRAQHYFEKTEREEQESDKEKEDADNDPVVVEQKRVKAKRHYVGNIRFISELYKFDMLTDKVILSCFGKLLPKRIDFTDADEEKMECLCKLLMTCAEKIANTASVKFFFDQLQKMIDLKVTSSRIRFLMQDAIDLKNNNFVQRKNAVQGLKTKEEVRKEKMQEEMQTKQETMTAIHQMPPMPMSQGRLPLGPDRNRLPPAHVQGGLKSVRTAPDALSAMPGAMGGRDNRQSGSMVQQQAAVKTSSVASKPSKFLSTYKQDRSGGQGGPVPLGWARGSSALNPSSTAGSVLFDSRMDNRSATNSRENSISRGEQRNSLTNTSDMRIGTPTLSLEPSSNLSSPQMTPAATPRTGSPVNLSIPDEAVEDLVSVPDEGVEDLVGNPDEEVEDLAPVSDEGVEDFTQRLVTAILNTEETEMEGGMKEASNKIARLNREQTARFIVDVAGNMYIEAKKPDRFKYGTLLVGLAKEGRLTPDILANGFGQLTALTEDQVVDVPQYRDYVVDMLAPLVVKDFFPLDRLDEVFEKSTVGGDVNKYHLAFRSWLQGPDRISVEEKKALVNKNPRWEELLQ